MSEDNIESKKLLLMFGGLAVVMTLLVTGIFGFDAGVTSSTTLPAVKQVKDVAVKINNWQKEATGALFDIVIRIPDKYKRLEPGEPLNIAVDLTNVGGPGKTDVYLSYIIINQDSQVVMIDHEKIVVKTQTSFLKSLDLPPLKFGQYNVFAEMLYSNTSAISTDTFFVS